MKYSLLILDLDGTVYVDGEPINNIIPKLNQFISEGNRVIYLSNNTSVNRLVYYNKLNKLGLKVEMKDIVTPVVISGTYLSEKYDSGYIVGTESFKNEMLHEFGVKQNSKTPDFVLLAFDTELTYEKLKCACHHINSGIPYYITHIDLACPSANGPIPDCGSIYKLIESVTKKEAKGDFGKPSNAMVSFIEKITAEIPKEKILMCGDRIYTDMVLGAKLCSDTLLVLSGESNYEDIEKGTNITYCSETLSDFLDGRTLLIN